MSVFRSRILGVVLLFLLYGFLTVGITDAKASPMAASVNSGNALTISPNPPIAGQPIVFSGFLTGSSQAYAFVYHGSGCIVLFVLYGSLAPGPYRFTVDGGLPAGSYSILIPGDASGCVNFTVHPAPAPMSPVQVD